MSKWISKAVAMSATVSMVAFLGYWAYAERAASIAEMQEVYAKLGWRAEDYFDDPQVLALCDAIERSDLTEMERLIDAGVDVNARGKGNVTPLLWAYPGEQIERFRLLLERGADPNVQLTEYMPKVGKLVKSRYVVKGDSVTWLAWQSNFDGFLETALKHGGDANQMHPRWLRPPLPFAAMMWRFENVKLLAEHGADVDWRDGDGPYGMTPAMTAMRNQKYEMALLLLELGADTSLYSLKGKKMRVIHYLAESERVHNYVPRSRKDQLQRPPWSAIDGMEEAHQQVVDWLESRGEDYEEAQEEERRWYDEREKDR